MDVDLPAEIEAVVRRKVAAGEYPSVAALVEEALFLLVERDWHAAQQALQARGGPGLDFGAPGGDDPGGGENG